MTPDANAMYTEPREISAQLDAEANRLQESGFTWHDSRNYLHGLWGCGYSHKQVRRIVTACTANGILLPMVGLKKPSEMER